MSNQVVAVFGSTGRQGSGVVQSLLESYPVRALTRNPSKLDHLDHPNLTVVQVDPSDTAAIFEALRGVWTLFVNTFSDYTQPLGTEEKLGKSLADAAAAAGVEWLIYSSLPEGVPFRAFDEKANVMKYARDIAKKSNLKNIFIHMGYYMSNLYFVKPVVNPDDGVVEFRWSTIDKKTYLPLISTETDVGPIVKAILDNPEKWNDAEIPIVGDVLTLPQIAEVYSKVYSRPTRVVILDHIPQEKIFEGWAPMHKAYNDVGYYPTYAGREHEIPKLARGLYPGIKTWEQWLRDGGLDLSKEN